MCDGHHHGPGGSAGFDIEILPDGTVRVDTGDLSGPKHMAAEQFLLFLARELGGESKRVRRAATHVHAANTARKEAGH